MLLFGMVFMYLIPFGIWFSLRQWKPKTRKSYSAKFAFWPLIFCSHSLGYPLARAIFGMPSRYSPNLAQAIPAIILLGVLGSPFAFGIGYLIARKKFK